MPGGKHRDGSGDAHVSRAARPAFLSFLTAVLAGVAGAAVAQESIDPDPTNTLADVSCVRGIRQTVSGGANASLVMLNDRSFQMSADVTAEASIAAIFTSFDNPNTVPVESTALSALDSNGVFKIGLQDTLATTNGVISLLVDDALGGSDFVFLNGVDGTARVWQVPLSYFSAVDSNQITDVAIVLFHGGMSNDISSLKVHFRGHPHVPSLTGSLSVTNLSPLAGVACGVTTAYPPVAVCAALAGGVVTSLAHGVTSVTANFSLSGSDSIARFQVDRGTLDMVEFNTLTTGANDRPAYGFASVTGNLYAVESSTDMVNWQVDGCLVSTNGPMTVPGATGGPGLSVSRLQTQLFPPQNPGSPFAVGVRIPLASRALLELIDAQGIAAPFRLTGMPALARYSVTLDPALLPEGFDTASIDSIRLSFPRAYTNYPSGLRQINSSTNGTMSLQFGSAIGSVAPPRP